MELKAKRGTMRKSQKDMALMFSYNGHTIHKVKSFKRARRILENGREK